MKVVKSLFGSKKFIGFLIGLVLEIVVASGLMDLSPDVRDQLMQWVGLFTGTYVVGQSLADIGKEKAKIERGTP